ncbi:MAG TPA: ribonuclease H-like domain-containing protein [Nitrospira sp.]|nr:ribonuclease H-like domain-containing protein [Nitrospira sp.]
MDVLQTGFTFLPGIGRARERDLHRQGIYTWSDFLAAPSVEGLSVHAKARYDALLSQARRGCSTGKSRQIGVLLPGREHWRLYEWLRSQAAYVDIETDSWGRIVVVGIFARARFRSFVRGESLYVATLAAELTKYALLVTFNGTAFDLPRLLDAFPALPLDHPHFDLRIACRRLGYVGGLKAVEQRLGILRPPEVSGLHGGHAVRLWNRWRYARDEAAKQRLLTYNRADCMNLMPLADHCYCEMARRAADELSDPSAGDFPSRPRLRFPS